MAWDFGLGDIAKVGGPALAAPVGMAGYQSMQDINAINRMAASGNYGVGNRMPQSFMNTLKGAYTPSDVFQKTGYPTGLKNWFTSRSSPQHFGPVEGVMKAGSKLKNFAGGMGGAGRYGLGALRLAGLTNPVGAAGAAAYVTPKIIDALTKRDADATETSMFGLNLQNLEDKAAAYDAGDTNMPGATLNDWGFPSGKVPVAGDEIQEEVTETLDPSWQHQLELQGINREGIQKPGFFEGIGQKLGMTQVSDADRAANQQFMQEQGIGVDETGRMVGGDFEGMNLPGQSAWGSANFGEMAQNWLDKYGDVEYSDTVHGRRNKAKQDKIKKAAEDYALTLQEQERIEQDKTVQQPTIPSGGDRGTFTGPHPDTPTKSPAEGGWHPGVAQGGYMRSRYNQGGRVGILSVF